MGCDSQYKLHIVMLLHDATSDTQCRTAIGRMEVIASVKVVTGVTAQQVHNHDASHMWHKEN